jgi:peptide-methionine (S)-S-oxide reductase
MSYNKNLETATFANGCFWCTEAVFQQLEGVEKVTSGYTGGHVADPTYEEVCDKNTGHAEALKIEFDPSKISFEELLEVFWATHDPTTVDRQGNDIGPQYRSVIFYHNEEQKMKAEVYKKQLNKSGVFDSYIVTALEPASVFYAAEDYHNNYYLSHPAQSYCYYVIKPKLDKLKKVFSGKLRLATN